MSVTCVAELKDVHLVSGQVAKGPPLLRQRLSKSMSMTVRAQRSTKHDDVKLKVSLAKRRSRGERAASGCFRSPRGCSRSLRDRLENTRGRFGSRSSTVFCFVRTTWPELA